MWFKGNQYRPEVQAKKLAAPFCLNDWSKEHYANMLRQLGGNSKGSKLDLYRRLREWPDQKAMMATKPYHTHKGVSYWPTFIALRAYLDARPDLANSRVVEDLRGYAIQREKSGPYWNADTEVFQ